MKQQGFSSGQEGESYKFLGKEMAYYEGLFRLWQAIMQKVAKGEDVTNLVNHLDASFPYKDKQYYEMMKKPAEKLKKGLNVTDKYGHADEEKRQKAITEFTMTKYEELVKLFKRKKVFPQEAEEEVYD